VEAHSTPLNIYISGIGNCIHTLPRHVQRLVGNIPTLDTPREWDITEPKDLIVETDGSVLFGVGYHSWVIATSEEDLLITGGGLDDGDPLLMTSSRSELGGLAAGLAVLGTLTRSGLINICVVRCVCDNKSAILDSKRQPSDSIFHKAETDYDVISTIHELQEMWRNNLEINYSWVKGHADKLDREPDNYERLNILAGEICDDTRAAATGNMGARGSCAMWLSETCTLFTRCVKITSHMKERLTRQLLDGDMQTYLMDKESWSRQDFDSVNWRGYGTAFKRPPCSRQTAMAKVCYRLWHTG
jgi:ribonuclease HI